jgi:hypothetical protein
MALPDPLSREAGFGFLCPLHRVGIQATYKSLFYRLKEPDMGSCLVAADGGTENAYHPNAKNYLKFFIVDGEPLYFSGV